MFQYAAGVSLAERHGTRLAIDKTWFDAHKHTVDAPRTYELDCFRLPEDFVTADDYIVIGENDRSLKRRIYLRTRAAKQAKVSHYNEPHYHYDPSFLKQSKHTLVEGFFQSEKYFSNVRRTLLERFTFAKDPSGDNNKLAEKITKSNAVSLHVRRSDYASVKATKETHGLMGMDYYKAAADYIAKRAPDPTFYVISDDPEWCKKNLKLPYSIVYVENKDGWKDMQLMSMCRHHITANSSFSWWGSWLDPHTEKIVVAPKKWFVDGSMNTKDVVPEAWVRL